MPNRRGLLHRIILDMKTVQVSLPEKSGEFVAAQAAKSGYRDAGEYLAALVQRERGRALREELEQTLVAALGSPSSPMTAADWTDIRRQGRGSSMLAGASDGRSPKPDSGLADEAHHWCRSDRRIHFPHQ
jgi:hypothetical protein